MTLDIEHLLTALTVAEKASLTSGSAFWYTAAVERLGIPKIMVSDGPHGLRAQPGESDHLGLGGSVPAGCFPTASVSMEPSLPLFGSFAHLRPEVLDQLRSPG